jgi:hypothetical protein
VLRVSPLLISAVSCLRSAGSSNQRKVNSVRTARPISRKSAARLFYCLKAESFFRISNGVTTLLRLASTTWWISSQWARIRFESSRWPNNGASLPYRAHGSKPNSFRSDRRGIRDSKSRPSRCMTAEIMLVPLSCPRMPSSA